MDPVIGASTSAAPVNAILQLEMVMNIFRFKARYHNRFQSATEARMFLKLSLKKEDLC